MSSSVAIDPTMMGLQLGKVGVALILEGVKELNYSCEMNQQMLDCQGKIINVELLIKNLQGEKIGICTNEKGEAEFFLEDLKSVTALEAIKQIRQRYMKYKVLHEVSRQGYRQIKQEKLPNGSIRIVVEKWE